MSYDAFAQKTFGATAVWLFEIEYSGVIERFASTARDFISVVDAPVAGYLAGTVWSAATIQRSAVKEDKQDRASIDLVFPHSSAVATSALGATGSPVYVRVWQGYLQDTVDNEFRTIFSGYVRKIFPTWLGIKVVCVDHSALMAESVLGRVVQRPCPYALFSPACGVDKASNQVTMTVSAVVGTTLTVVDDGGVANFYTYGNLEYAGANQTIRLQEANTLVLAGTIPSFPVAPFDVLVSRPCFKTPAACNGFGASLNFGGFEAMNRSPYDGRSLV